MSDPSPLSLGLTLLSGALGAGSSAVLLCWALKMAPKKQAVASAEAIPKGSGLGDLARDATANIKTDMPVLVIQELGQVKLSAALLLSSFLIGLVAPFV